MSDIHQHTPESFTPKPASASSGRRSQLRSAGSNPNRRSIGSAGSVRSRPGSSLSRSPALIEDDHGEQMSPLLSTSSTLLPDGESLSSDVVRHSVVPPITPVQRENSASNGRRHNGREMSAKHLHEDGLVSEACQTEWSWIQDMNSRPPTIAIIPTPLEKPGSAGTAKSNEDTELADDGSKRPFSAHMKTPGLSIRSLSSAQGMDTSGLYTEMSEQGEPIPFIDDTYGIPVLELSDSSDDPEDSSEEELIKENVAKKKKRKKKHELPSIGPPQILKYNREGDAVPGTESNGSSEAGGSEKNKEDTVFEGVCEFCKQTIRPFPTVSAQQTLPPEELFCCEEYRDFINFMITHPLHDEFKQETEIDIKPHPPYGSKKSRNEAKEKAAQRMREREMEKQKTSLSLMSGGNSGLHGSNVPGGAPGAPPGLNPGGAHAANFYQFARQMKTINYQLSSQKCLDEGWTVRPPSPMIEEDGDEDIFEPQPVLPVWVEGSAKHQKDGNVIMKFYENGSLFLCLFSDGTGSVFYRSGNVAINISSMEIGFYTYILMEDKKEASVLAVFTPEGHASTYHSNGIVRLCMDQLGGIELDVHGARKRLWQWNNPQAHVHAPPLQPITFAINNNLSVRIFAQNQMKVTYKSGSRSCRFQVAAHLKVLAAENVPIPEIDNDQLYRDEIKAKTEKLFKRVASLLKFPNSKRLNQMPDAQQLTLRRNKLERRKTTFDKLSLKKEKKLDRSATVIVN